MDSSAQSHGGQEYARSSSVTSPDGGELSAAKAVGAPRTPAPPSALEELAISALERAVASMGGSPRQGQEQMVREICAAIEKNERVLIQAGTGTGKSLGYLLPALAFAALSGGRSLVSTATLALQRQVVSKDVPIACDAVEALTGVRPDVALLKGWGNYLCLNKVHGGYPAEEGTLFDGGSEVFDSPTTTLGREILRIRKWAKKTTTGDRDDIPRGVSDKAWRQVSLQRRECLGKSCSLYDECFPQKARDHAMEADLIVTNHSLVGINATSEGELFPEIDCVIIDEAHDLAERVRHQTSVVISEGSVLRVARSARTHGEVDTQALEEAAVACGAVLASMEDGLVRSRPEALQAVLGSVDVALRDALSQLSDSRVEAASKQLARAALEELLGAMDVWNRPADQSITWVNRQWRDGEILAPELIVAALDVAVPIGTVALGEGAAVMTSATLSLGHSFNAIAQQNGLMVSSIPWHGVDVGTPFKPEKQGILYVPTHLPDPGRNGVDEQALDELVALAKASGGGVLALFSSWKGVEAGAQALREHTDLKVLVHGDATVTALVDEFREDRDSCLVGTMSLWQGVDVAGASCRLVVIDRIPFPRPDDPVVQARSHDAEKRGMSGFQVVSLNHAALMMAQASGRLLRTSEDKGVVAVLDRRLVTKPYGGFIRSSMQPLWPTQDRAVVLEALARLRDAADREEIQGV